MIEQYYPRLFRKHLYRVAAKCGHKHGEDFYIPIQHLMDEWKDKMPVPEQYRHNFFFFLALAVCLDELIFTHFPADYGDFKATTRYPKVEYGITGTHIRPWKLVKLKHSSGRWLFHSYAKVFLRERRVFFRTQKYRDATWENVEKAMAADPDVCGGAAGTELMKVLRELRDEEKEKPPSRTLSEEQQKKLEKVLRDLSISLRGYKNTLRKTLKVLRNREAHHA